MRAALLCLLLVGCSEQEMRQYEVDKLPLIVVIHPDSGVTCVLLYRSKYADLPNQMDCVEAP